MWSITGHAGATLESSDTLDYDILWDAIQKLGQVFTEISATQDTMPLVKKILDAELIEYSNGETEYDTIYGRIKINTLNAKEKEKEE